METVEILESSLVAPSEATPKEAHWLSNFDVAIPPRIYTPVIYIYRCNGDPNFFSATSVKAALAKALVLFYPFAGRLSTGKGGGRVEIDCNGEGALFVVARCKLALDRLLRDYVPSAENRKLFVPAVVSDDTPPLLLLQVTFLESGNVVIGAAFSHCVADIGGDFHFMQTLTNLARGNTSTVPPPFLDRTLLQERSPPFYSPNHPENLHVRYLRSLGHTSTHPPFVSAILKLSKEQIDYLKNHPSRESASGTVSTFQAVSAHIWKCVCLARRLSHDKESHLLFPVGVHSRISPPLPKYFFGNTGTFGLVSAKVSEVIGFIPETIRESIAQVDDAYVRESIDYLEVADEKNLSKRYGMTAYDMFVTSWLGTPCYDADFGYGNPVFVTRAETGIGGIAVLMNNPGTDRGVSVLVGLEVESMEQFKTNFYDLNCN